MPLVDDFFRDIDARWGTPAPAKIRTFLACPDRLEPHDRPRLRRVPKNVEQSRRKLQAACVDGSLDGGPDRFIRVGCRPKTAPRDSGSAFLSRETPLFAGD